MQRKYKSATTATREILGRTAAQQHSYENKHGRQPQRKLLSFEEWLETGFQHFESKGGKVESIPTKDGIVVFMKKPNGEVTVRTDIEFRNEYRRNYLGQTAPSVCEVY